MLRFRFMRAEVLVERLERFVHQWISNPAAQLELANLVRATLQVETHDHADEVLVAWLDEQVEQARRLGVR